MHTPATIDVPAPRAPSASWHGTPFLLATAAAADARPATLVAMAFVAERGAVPHVLRVRDIPALDVAALGLDAYPTDPFVVDDASEGDDVRAVRAELAVVGVPSLAPWSVRIDVGTPSACIVREAARVDAELIVIGLRRHAIATRRVGGGTTIHVLGEASCPVLAVADAHGGRPALAGLPRRVLVGIDFGRASHRAAHAALALIAGGGALVLAHITSQVDGASTASDESEADDGATRVHALGFDAAFEELVMELTAAMPVGRAVTLEWVTAPHVPGHRVARELLAMADRAGADLIAVATHRLSRLERFIVGSVTAELAGSGEHTLLVVPAEARTALET